MCREAIRLPMTLQAVVISSVGELHILSITKGAIPPVKIVFVHFSLFYMCTKKQLARMAPAATANDKTAR